MKRISLSDEDRSIWEKVSKTFDRHPKMTERKKSQKIRDVGKLNILSTSYLVTKSEQTLNFRKDNTDFLSKGIRNNHNQLYPGLDRKRHDLLKKGKISPEKSIDLHGLSAKRAEEAVLGFLFQSYSQGIRLVLVITGKGRSSIQKESNFFHETKDIGIIKKSLTSWIKNSDIMPLILYVAPAHSKHGGGGAFYVYLKKRNIR